MPVQGVLTGSKGGTPVCLQGVDATVKIVYSRVRNPMRRTREDPWYFNPVYLNEELPTQAELAKGDTFVIGYCADQTPTPAPTPPTPAPASCEQLAGKKCTVVGPLSSQQFTVNATECPAEMFRDYCKIHLPRDVHAARVRRQLRSDEIV